LLELYTIRWQKVNGMKILILNPNTTAAMTASMLEAAKDVAAPGSQVDGSHPRFGPASIEGFYEEAVSALGVVDEIRRGEQAGYDGYVLACFGDPGLNAARELARGPVVGIAEAAFHFATLVAPNFSVVTTLARTITIAEELLVRYGFQHRCRRVRAAEIPVLALEEDERSAYQAIRAECELALRADGCEAIVLGCGGMAKLCAQLTRELDVPVIDGVVAGVKLVEGLVAAGLRTSKRLSYDAPRTKAMSGDLGLFRW
jgi:allantoin racemase